MYPIIDQQKKKKIRSTLWMGYIWLLPSGDPHHRPRSHRNSTKTPLRRLLNTRTHDGWFAGNGQRVEIAIISQSIIIIIIAKCVVGVFRRRRVCLNGRRMRTKRDGDGWSKIAKQNVQAIESEINSSRTWILLDSPERRNTREEETYAFFVFQMTFNAQKSCRNPWTLCERD